MRTYSHITMGILGLIGFSAFASATTVTPYSDQSLFSSVAGIDAVIDFNSTGVPSMSSQDYSTADGLTVDGVQFVGYRPNDDPVFYLVLSNPGVGDPAYWGTGTLLRGPGCWNCVNTDSTRRLTILLPSPVTALSLNLMTWSSSGNGVTVSLSNGWSSGTIATPASGVPAWLGLTSDTPFNSVDIRSLAGLPMIDNLSYGNLLSLPLDPGGDPMTPTPEPAGILLIGSGLGFLGFRLRRRYIKG